MDERVEVVDLGVAHRLDEALDHAAVQRAHEVGVGLGQLAERAVGEGDDGGLAVVGAVDRGVEAEAVELGDERFEAATARRRGGGVGRALARGRPRRRRRRWRRPSSARRTSMRASSGKVGGSRPSDGGVGGERSRGAGGGRPPCARRCATSSRPTSRMRSRWGRTVFGCRPSASAMSAVASGFGRAGQLEVDGVARVVAEGLEEVEPGDARHRPRVYTATTGRMTSWPEAQVADGAAPPSRR